MKVTYSKTPSFPAVHYNGSNIQDLVDFIPAERLDIKYDRITYLPKIRLDKTRKIECGNFIVFENCEYHIYTKEEFENRFIVESDSKYVETFVKVNTYGLDVYKGYKKENKYLMSMCSNGFEFEETEENVKKYFINITNLLRGK
jgi:hypothetical protein